MKEDEEWEGGKGREEKQVYGMGEEGGEVGEVRVR